MKKNNKLSVILLSLGISNSAGALAVNDIVKGGFMKSIEKNITEESCVVPELKDQFGTNYPKNSPSSESRFRSLRRQECKMG